MCNKSFTFPENNYQTQDLLCGRRKAMGSFNLCTPVLLEHQIQVSGNKGLANVLSWDRQQYKHGSDVNLLVNDV